MRLRRKLLLVLLGFSLVAGILLDLSGSTLLRASLRALASERLERESALVADLLPPSLDVDPASLASHVEAMATDLGVRVTIIAPDGIVLADSEVPDRDVPSMENHLERPEVQDALARGTGRSRRVSTTLGTEMSYFARLLHGPEGPSGFLRLAIPTASLEAGAGSLRAAAIAMAAAVFLLFSALAYALTRRISAPVERIAREADMVASGRYETPIGFQGGGAEIAALSSGLERMRRSLLDQIDRVEAERRLTETVLSGMREGLLAVDTNQRTILANASLRKGLGLGEAPLEGRPLAEVIRDPEAGEAFERCLKLRDPSRVSITLRFPTERSFEVAVSPLDSPDGSLLGAIGIFFDVTRLQALERMRRDFIADLSHEMRTPLTSLDAAVDNLLGAAGGDEEDRTAFLGIVRRNVERMKTLIDDLTDLSLIETGAIQLEPEHLLLEDVVADAIDSLRNKAASMEVSIHTEIPQGLRVRADRRRLDQVLVNVIDNAIKFNRKRGAVRIAARPVEGRIEVAVEDTGDGILPSNHERVFHRFFRADAGRSRQAGGTGLGLAIVKHLMRLHEGSVRAEPREGGGTRIVLVFPAARPVALPER